VTSNLFFAVQALCWLGVLLLLIRIFVSNVMAEDFCAALPWGQNPIPGLASICEGPRLLFQ
jgi:hypothetical protein